ncbi:GGDEF domain-containing protein [Paenibacillus sp. CCS19]|uniref:GGDEF domain-containing protein n=1 Tax=Paenibacillus sp. CCS19 TaxID=3158387 RepID=UPI00255EB2E6|nr:GGDEF domain-containing protein [Paenibacillus cellulosilyticus]GMK37784.1 GGDEF domain-containing protein [Paenibacillus cellulosilyticus]
MSIVLDARTVFATLLIGYLIALVLTLAYWNGSLKLATLKVYIGAKSMQAIALYFAALRGHIPDVLSVLLANSMLFIVYTLEICVLLSLQRILTVRMKWLYVILTLASIAGFLFIYFFNNQEETRIAFASVLLAIIFLPAYRLIVVRGASPLARVMGTLYLCVGIWMLIRSGGAVLGHNWASFYQQSDVQLPMLLVLFLIIVVGHTGIVLLMKEQSHRELVRLANQDDLTGALNRRTFAIRAERQLARYAKKRQPLSYMLFDVDRFKIINDTYGHYVGDQVLQHLASRVRQHLGTQDMLVRYGGDEFGILLPGLDEEASAQFAEQMISEFAGVDDQQLPTTYSVSVGILTVIPNARTTMENLYITCDQALYAAKRDGRNRIIRVQEDRMAAVPMKQANI